MQGSSSIEPWAPPTGVLGALTAAAFERAHAVVHQEQVLRRDANERTAPPSFAHALRQPHVGVIAEVKRSSPSKGAIAPGIDARSQAIQYEKGGAAAISVLTEPSKFGGSLDDLADVCAAVSIPVLRKDFIVHPVQIWEARVAGASAVLLIVRALEPTLLQQLVLAAREAGLDALVEIRDERELDVALDAGAAIIGVNNRNLETLHIDVNTAPRVIRSIPPHVIAIAESGIQVPEDARAAVGAGADALLVGSAVSAANSPSDAVRALTSFERVSRVGRNA